MNHAAWCPTQSGCRCTCPLAPLAERTIRMPPETPAGYRRADGSTPAAVAGVLPDDRGPITMRVAPGAHMFVLPLEELYDGAARFAGDTDSTRRVSITLPEDYWIDAGRPGVLTVTASGPVASR